MSKGEELIYSIPFKMYINIYWMFKGGTQDLRRYTLSQSLITAREARYRHIADNYKRTMKQFHDIDYHLSHLRQLLSIMKWQINKDYDDITTYTMLVNEDCKRSRNMLKRTSLVINTEVSSGRALA